MDLQEIYYQDAYQQSFTAEVLSCQEVNDGFAIVLSQTAFYPEGGGQPSDVGFLDTVEVYDVHEKNGQILHYTKEKLEVGSIVQGEINWQRRFDHMQNHTAEHIVSGLIHRNYGYDNVGFHMGHVIQIDFNGELSWRDVQDIEAQANQVIYQNLPVVQSIYLEGKSDKEYRTKIEINDVLRLIEVEGADCCACCGTHVKNTGEIGIIKMLSLAKNKQGVRIEMLAGEKARKYLEKIYEENHAISVALSAKPEETASAVETLQNQLVESVKEVKRMQEVYLSEKQIVSEDGVVIEFFPPMDKHMLTKCANDLLKEEMIHTVAFLMGEEDQYQYLIFSKLLPLSSIAKKMNEELSGKGGGNDQFVQGVFNASGYHIQKVVEELLVE